MNIETKITAVEFTPEERKDILDVAFYGGINHWACRAEPVGDHFNYLITTVEGTQHAISARNNQMDTAATHIANEMSETSIGQSMIHALTIHDTDIGEIDADLADAILQVVFFGELIYG